MGIENLLPLRCDDETLALLSSPLAGFGVLGGDPDWLVAVAWLRFDDQHVLCSPAIEVQDDGFVARPLAIDSPERFTSDVSRQLPDIRGRLRARGREISLPGIAEPRPANLTNWDGRGARVQIAARIAARRQIVDHVAAALLFETRNGDCLLVGADPEVPTLILSEDRGLVNIYCRECEMLEIADYRTALAR